MIQQQLTNTPSVIEVTSTSSQPILTLRESALDTRELGTSSPVSAQHVVMTPAESLAGDIMGFLCL